MPEKAQEVQEKVKAIFGCSPCLWQIEAARNVLAGKDVITVAPTGAGKSLTYWMPLIFSETGIVMVVLPLKQLGSQFAATLNEKGLRAVSVTADNSSNVLYSDIKKGQYRVVMFSPEIIDQDSRFDALIKSRKFTDNLINIVFDEAHCIKEWGSSFRQAYSKLGHLRHLMPRRVPYHLGTATMPPSLLGQLKKDLRMNDDTVILRLNTDRPNIFFRVRPMEYPINSYHDLSFLIPNDLDPDGPFPLKFLVFFNSRNEAEQGARFLRSRLPPTLRDKVKWVHSGMTDEFREEAIHALKVGEDIGECATDAVGLGIDIPDVYIIAQYRAPKSMNTWLQRAGRAVRDLRLLGMAILLAEPTLFDNGKAEITPTVCEMPGLRTYTPVAPPTIDGDKENVSPSSTSHPSTKPTDGRRRVGFQQSSRKRKAPNEGQHSAARRKRTKKGVDVAKIRDIFGHEIKVERAMDDFINAEHRTEKCRRKIAAIHFGNVDLAPIIPTFCCLRCAPRAPPHCCDICEPQYWPVSVMDAYDRPRTTYQYRPKEYERGPAEMALREALVAIRRELWREKFPGGSILSPQALMPTVLLDRVVDLAHYGRLETMVDIRKQLDWAYAEKCGPSILVLIEKMCPVSEKHTRLVKRPSAVLTSPFTSTPLRQAPSTPFARTYDNIDSTPLSPCSVPSLTFHTPAVSSHFPQPLSSTPLRQALGISSTTNIPSNSPSFVVENPAAPEKSAHAGHASRKERKKTQCGACGAAGHNQCEVSQICWFEGDG
ncbi:P-loop containing nucleoside triphosphate hydrolase protein [Armillaria luteobubalina]|uniref:DNA 3'-5' helicase n=1 Tax=Armillaria luteobubalina TaxID=153913 RepID=A0AA39UVV5_9AGAR|nr:P-loop containing nucleoside triphosphate hydrolase protein [Armillaria luteobubalina]